MVMDSFGIGGAKDAAAFGDEGSNTFLSVSRAENFDIPNLAKLGFYHIDGVRAGASGEAPDGAYARVCERSHGKDTTIGHWEIAGSYSEDPLPTYPDGFPKEIIEEFEHRSG